MKIKWYGHSCFLLTDSNGVSILTDPFSPQTMYELPKISASAVTVSHDHSDHNYINAVSGSSCLIRTAEKFDIGGVGIEGVKTFHDPFRGTVRGENIMFVYEMDGMRILHCGDLGEIPPIEAINSLGRIDILLVPIGAIYTIDDLQARELVDMLEPEMVIPMHYKNPKLSFELCPLEPFAEGMKQRNGKWSIKWIAGDELTVTSDTLISGSVVILKPFEP